MHHQCGSPSARSDRSEDVKQVQFLVDQGLLDENCEDDDSKSMNNLQMNVFLHVSKSTVCTKFLSRLPVYIRMRGILHVIILFNQY